jgi:hypothetical protein
MTANATIGASGDRRGDARGDGLFAFKPPASSRNLQRWICLASLAVIVYGTVGPVGLHGGPWLRPRADWQWTLRPAPTDFNDVYTNFLVYLPVGVALRLLLRRRGVAGWVDFVLAGYAAAGLSYATELAQQFIPVRSSNLNDFYVNTLAALCGAGLAPWLQSRWRQWHAAAYGAWHRTPWTLAAAVLAVTALVLMTAPFAPRRPSVDWVLTRPLGVLDARRAGLFAILTAALALARAQRGQWPAVMPAAARAALLATGLEVLQAGLQDHACSPLEWGLECGGAALGALLARRWVRRLAADRSALADGAWAEDFAGRVDDDPRPRPAFARDADADSSHAPVWGAVVLVLLMAYTFWALRPAAAPGERAAGWGIALPFDAEFGTPFAQVVTECVERLMLLAALAAGCCALRPSMGRVLAATVLAGVVGGAALVRALSGVATVDLTPTLLAGVAWLLAGHLWRLLQPLTLTPATALVSGARAAAGLNGRASPAR